MVGAISKFMEVCTERPRGGGGFQTRTFTMHNASLEPDGNIVHSELGLCDVRPERIEYFWQSYLQHHASCSQMCLFV